MAAPAAATAAGATDLYGQCFVRIYDARHLAAHPGQRVVAMPAQFQGFADDPLVRPHRWLSAVLEDACRFFGLTDAPVSGALAQAIRSQRSLVILDGVDGRTDSMFGDSGNDSLFGDYHKDEFSGGSGDDLFFDEFEFEF